ncbi:MAG TPA: hypothetical protein VGL47_15995 [Amycolatopsis sp.]|uniref:hypothetical protein n=1 Tax=Amycolatopsis sp. TaxID=37632 RepID=UPI002F42E7ED
MTFTQCSQLPDALRLVPLVRRRRDRPFRAGVVDEVDLRMREPVVGPMVAEVVVGRPHLGDVERGLALRPRPRAERGRPRRGQRPGIDAVQLDDAGELFLRGEARDARIGVVGHPVVSLFPHFRPAQRRRLLPLDLRRVQHPGQAQAEQHVSPLDDVLDGRKTARGGSGQHETAGVCRQAGKLLNQLNE